MVSLCTALTAIAVTAWLSFGRVHQQATAAPLPGATPTTTANGPAPHASGNPTASAIRRALKWASRRKGIVGVGVVDSRGMLHGYHAHRQFVSASLAKAMLLVAYLRRHPRPSTSARATLTTMIEESDNESADAIFDEVGNRGLKGVARLAHMRDFEVGISWIDTEMTPADQARFFYTYEEHLPPRARTFARRLLSGITSMQRWGIPAAGGPAGWKVFFKGGWLGSKNEVMNQAAWLEKDGVRWSLAVLTADDPTSSYGWQTQKGFTGLLIGRKPTTKYLAIVHEGDGGR